jgi:peptidoglycan/LPS O-acetylase OafA/YrhL
MRHERFPALDGLRAAGALAVLTTHVGFQSGAALEGPFAGVLARLDAGVAVFFVISGFLLYRPHARAWIEGTDRPATGRYLRNRALRILPALWIAVTLAALLLAINDGTGLASYLRHAALVHIYVDGAPVHGLTQMWSLATEAAFYLLLPVLARLLDRIGGDGRPGRREVGIRLAVLAGFVLLGPCWMAAVAGDHPRAGLWLPGYLGWFAVGMAFAVWHVARSNGLLAASYVDVLARVPGTLWAAALGVYLIAASPVAGPYELTGPTPGQAFMKNLFYTVVAACVVLPAVGVAGDRAPPAVRVLGGRVAHYLGDISYGVFAYHVVLLGVVTEASDYVLFSGGFFRLFGATLVMSVAAATVSYYLVERPIMRWGRRDSRYDVSPPPGDVPPAGAPGDSAASAKPKSTSA